jgi:hypothetical protein
MKQSSEAVPPIRKQLEDTLRRARQLPVGPYRNDLRQLAKGLGWLEKHDRDEELGVAEPRKARAQYFRA